ncbi:thiol reductant ABC exporter subunit CydD [Aureimonas frigidaquae]|uniref:ABC transporter CydDC cysteine exporter family permease/ATP-binding protein CydD n=1 Tax=Aureimonas frigidaquae TaxID=424757 RepID=A0A0P0YZS3_9HYPH|nr:thiol reductant ABC exporter subunit CydD [Aureimonas frigidaquae]BAT27157.1 ABC transporter CydDC cysteine exporter family permease/ATP-binding protein CydD [Aureimonas frigidaquae]
MSTLGAGHAQRREHGRWLRRLSRGGGFALRLATVLPVLSGLLLIPQAWLLAGIVDAVLREPTDPAALAAPIAGVFALFAARAGLALIGEHAALAAAERIKRALRLSLMAGVLQDPPRADADRSSGAVAALLVDQVDALDGFLVRFLPAMTQAAVLPLAFAAVVAPLDWVVAVIFVLTAPLIILFMALVGWGAQAASDTQATALTRLSAYFADRLSGLVTLALMRRGEDEVLAMRQRSDELRARTFRVLRIAFLSSAVLEFFAALGVAGVALYIGLAYLGMVGSAGAGATLSAGLFCLLMAPEVYQPLRLLAAHYHDRAGALAAVAQMEAALTRLPEAGPDLPRFAGQAAAGLPAGPLAIDADALCLATPTGRILLRQTALHIEAGRHVALVGPSGCGKTSLIETLAGLRPAEGCLRIGGVELCLQAPAERAGAIAYIGQKPRLFRGTIADNIRFGREDADARAVQEAARLALVTAFTDGLPDGLDTMVGEGGYGLSGGQAHRVGLARLFLRDPGLVLLDEPTAHLDAQTEAQLIDNLMEFAKGRTMIAATHSAALTQRLSLRLGMSGHRLQPFGPAARDAIRLIRAQAA